MANKRITVIGGGTGVYVVLSALKNCGYDLSAVISMCDDGGSTGRLRDDYGILPPGDIRRSLIALSSANIQLRKLFEHRFVGGEIDGHSFGNLFLAACQQLTGSNLKEAVKLASEVLSVRGRVIPATLDNVRLAAKLENGKTIIGETNIDIPQHNPELKIVDVFTVPHASVNPEATKIIAKSDVIIIGPGDLYTSVVPNLLMRGMARSIRTSSAIKIYVCNLMTKNGETNSYGMRDFLATIDRYLGERTIDYALVNSKKPSIQRLVKYSKENSKFVSLNKKYNGSSEIIKSNLIADRGLIRHDLKKLRLALVKLIER